MLNFRFRQAYAPCPIIKRFSPFAYNFLAAADGRRIIHTKLHSNEFEYKTPKFLKNRQSLIFQKFAGAASPPPYQFAFC
jgi:hypothetical protein